MEDRYKDIVLLFRPCSNAPHFDEFQIAANSFLLRQATGAFFAATSNFSRTLGDIQVDAQGRSILVVPFALGNIIDEGAVRIFFSLIEEINMRSLSDSATVICSAIAARDRHEKFMKDALEHIIQIHALADFFCCSRIINWVHIQLPGILDDDMALVLLEYILTPYVAMDGSTRWQVNPASTELYQLLLMWTHCIRVPPAPDPRLEMSEFDARMEGLAQFVDNHTEYDMFSTRTVLSEDGHHLEMVGAVVKCAECHDQNTWRRPGKTTITMIHPMNTSQARASHVGFWSLNIEEASSASGKRWMLLQRVPPTICTSTLNATPHLAEGAPVPHAMAHTMSVTAVKQRDETHNTQDLSFACSMQSCFVRKGRRGISTINQMMSRRLEFTMTGAKSAIPMVNCPPGTTARSALWMYNVEIPAHQRQSEYYVGQCQLCRQLTPVSITCYRIHVDGHCPDQNIPPVQQETETDMMDIVTS